MSDYLGSFSDWRLERGRILSDSVDLAISGMVDGDVAEFGTNSGKSFAVLANALSKNDDVSDRHKASRKKLLGFDSYTGLPEPSLEPDLTSPLVTQGVWAHGSMKSSAMDAWESATKYLPAERVKIFAGLFADTLKQLVPTQKFSVVHLDCDLYESTRDVLQDLMQNNRLTDGSILLFDDYLENRGSPDFGQRRAWGEIGSQYSIRYTDLGFYGRGSWRCMIHL